MYKIYSFFLLIVICSCEKTDIGHLESDSNSGMINIPEYDTPEEFLAAIESTSKMSASQLQEWEQKKGFISLKSIYKDILKEENKIFDAEEALIESSPELAKTLKHQFSDLFEKNNQFVKYSKNFGYYLDIPNEDFAGLINENGIARIGEALYQYKESTIKVIKDGDESKIALLSKITTGTSTDNIEVKRVQQSGINSKNARPHGPGSFMREDVWDAAGQHLLIAQVETSVQAYTQIAGTAQWVSRVATYIRSRHLKQRWWGLSNFNTTDYSLSGNIRVTSFIYPTYGGGTFNTALDTAISEGAFDGNSANAAKFYHNNDVLSAWDFITTQTIYSSSINFQFRDITTTINF